MLTFIGILLIVAGIITIALKAIFGNHQKLQWINTKRSFQIIFIGIIFSIITGMFFYAEPGTAYAVQYP